MYEAYSDCKLCPRECGINRTAGKRGVCGESAELRIAAIEAHFGEEPPISGTRGSGTVFFSGCTLNCLYCQNYQISCFHMGNPMTVAEVVQRLQQLYQEQGIHNINFVTPDHFLPHSIDIVQHLRARGVKIPVLYNCSGYEKVDALQQLEEIADIYMPDYKYSDGDLAQALSRCRDYPLVALDAIAEMVRQKGFLDHFLTGQAIASRGVFVRHLVLPGQVQNSIDALSTLYAEFGAELPLSLMSQYWPARVIKHAELNRRLRRDEFYRVYDHALALGFKHMFVQHMDVVPESEDPFLPDFRQQRPFKGNIGK